MFDVCCSVKQSQPASVSCTIRKADRRFRKHIPVPTDGGGPPFDMRNKKADSVVRRIRAITHPLSHQRPLSYELDTACRSKHVCRSRAEVGAPVRLCPWISSVERMRRTSALHAASRPGISQEPHLPPVVYCSLWKVCVCTLRRCKC